MLSYSKSQLDLLFALINESNPGLVQRVDLNNVTLSAPRDYTPSLGEIANTAIDLKAVSGSVYIGRRTVTYRRINPKQLFTNVVPKIDKWTNNSLSPATLVAELNTKYGLLLTTADIPTGSYASSVSMREIAIQASSLCYKGTLPFYYVEGKRELNQIIQTHDFKGRYWDSVFDPAKPLMTVNGYGIDYSRFLGGIAKITNGSAINANAVNVRQLADWFSGYTGFALSVDVSHKTLGGLSGLTATKFSLPNSVVPEANASKFNSVLVISALADSWFCGKILMHYNT